MIYSSTFLKYPSAVLVKNSTTFISMSLNVCALSPIKKYAWLRNVHGRQFCEEKSILQLQATDKFYCIVHEEYKNSFPSKRVKMSSKTNSSKACVRVMVIVYLTLITSLIASLSHCSLTVSGFGVLRLIPNTLEKLIGYWEGPFVLGIFNMKHGSNRLLKTGIWWSRKVCGYHA